MFGKETIEIIKDGGIGVIPTDTIYGLVGSALNIKTVERIYEVRRRRPDKPSIILISKIEDLKLFDIELDEATREVLEKYWPGPVSIILLCPNKKFAYLHRGTNSLAFRLPAKNDLLKFLKQTGPLVAPSANPEGSEPAKTINEAKKYFDKQIDFYVDFGRLEAEPSALIRIEQGRIEVLRGNLKNN